MNESIVENLKFSCIICGKENNKTPPVIARVPIMLYSAKTVFYFLIFFTVCGRIACSSDKKDLVSDPVTLIVPINAAMISAR